MPTSTPFKFTASRKKRAAAKILDAVGVNRLGFSLQRKLLAPFIRAVNYHTVFPCEAHIFESHLRYYAENFVPVDLAALEAFLQTGEWRHKRPGLIISFDDGHPTHYKIAAPLLEKYNFPGWFFVPVGLMNLEGNTIPERHIPHVLTAEQLSYLDERHIVGSHTETHCRLEKSVEPERLEVEVGGSRSNLETRFGHSVSTFSWVGGEEESYSREASELIKKHYRFAFMTNSAVIKPEQSPFQLQRTNIEAGEPLSIVRFQLSGLMDILYANKRRRVNRLTA